MMTIVIFQLVILILLLFILVSNFTSSYFGSPYLKSRKEIIQKALKTAKLKPGEILYDLGCGNGDVLIEAENIGAKAIGYEISPFYYLWAKMRIFIWRKMYTSSRWSGKSGTVNGRMKIIFQNMVNVNLSKADVVYCYLMPSTLEKLTSKFQKELKKTARLISIDFQIKNMHLIDKLKVQNHTIYLYRSIL